MPTSARPPTSLMEGLIRRPESDSHGYRKLVKDGTAMLVETAVLVEMTATVVSMTFSDAVNYSNDQIIIHVDVSS